MLSDNNNALHVGRGRFNVCFEAHCSPKSYFVGPTCTPIYFDPVL